jgi:N-methylhydantoinase A
MGCRLEEAAEGIVRVANATMEAAIRSVSVRRGYDPGDFVLVAFGGAGGLHACELAESLGVPAVMIPPAPGVLSAYGLLCAEAIEERSRTLFLDPDERDDVERELESLEREVKELVAGGAAHSGRVRVERLADMRYVGQSFEISVPVGADLKRRFHSAHRRLYGHAVEEAAVEVVNLRVRGIRPGPAPPPMGVEDETARAGRHGGEIWWRGRSYRAAMHARGSLGSGRAIAGPSVVCEYSATTFIPPGWGGQVDPVRNLVLRPEGRGKR